MILRVRHKMFANHNYTASEIGGVVVGDEATNAPNVSMLFWEHPLNPFDKTGRVMGVIVISSRENPTAAT